MADREGLSATLLTQCLFHCAHRQSRPAYFRPPFACSRTIFFEGSNPPLPFKYDKTLRLEGLYYKWRIERDSNPRYALDVHTISNRAPSTTRPSIQNAYCLAFFIPIGKNYFKINRAVHNKRLCQNQTIKSDYFFFKASPKASPKVEPEVVLEYSSNAFFSSSISNALIDKVSLPFFLSTVLTLASTTSPALNLFKS